MSNIVINRVTITGPEEDIKAFRKKHFTREKGSKFWELDPETILPLPAGAGELDADVLWGTRWIGELNRIKHKPGFLDIKFGSPWSAPTGIFTAMSEQWPSLTFRIRSIEEFFHFVIDQELKGGGKVEMFTPQPGQAGLLSDLYEITTGHVLEMPLEEVEVLLADHEQWHRPWTARHSSAMEYVLLGILGVGGYLAIRDA